MKTDELDTLFTGIANAIREKEDSTEPIDAVDFPQRISAIPSGGNEVYSTEEVRIGTWIDGKPLYRKVFTGQTGATNSMAGIANLSGNNADVITSLCSFVLDGFNRSYMVPCTTENGYIYAVEVARKNVNIVTSISELAGRQCTLTCEYTKTTDSAET